MGILIQCPEALELSPDLIFSLCFINFLHSLVGYFTTGKLQMFFRARAQPTFLYFDLQTVHTESLLTDTRQFFLLFSINATMI
jgi:hypothetical protein